ncbi:hypothetical protein EI74_0678 [Mycoplasma testudineum]|uniref:Uncharacterized protein n=1 Tax=Mycoplasma testudineum TaxID=244584 RepID=A0A4V3C2V5_9MOLU|nr:hypothetical protein [Mycoplasma testudineum]OYD26576.1 hypothetical protein CG473_02980 [Mycoplasma testudineum]TDO19409.1 hypothetical protein EI74_0678 [Mycoplasma testudineum]
MDKNDFKIKIKESRIVKYYYENYQQQIEAMARRCLHVNYTSTLTVDDLVVYAISNTPSLLRKYESDRGISLINYLYAQWRVEMLNYVHEYNNSINKFNSSFYSYDEWNDIDIDRFAEMENLDEILKRLINEKRLCQLSAKMIKMVVEENLNAAEIKMKLFLSEKRFRFCKMEIANNLGEFNF